MQIEEKTFWEGVGFGLSAIAAWIVSSFRSGRAIGNFEAKYEERVSSVEKTAAELKETTADLQKTLDEMECIGPAECMNRHSESQKLIQMQFDSGTREFDEIKKMIQDNEKKSDERHQFLVEQLLAGGRRK